MGGVGFQEWAVGEREVEGVFFRVVGWGTFFKATLMSIIEIQNVFLIMNIDDLHRLRRV